MGKAVFQIDAPRDRLYGILVDFNRWSEWFPDCKEAKIVTDNESNKQVELVLASVKTIALGLEFDLSPTQLISFRKFSGKDIKEYIGSFRLMNASDGAGTVVMGEMEMDAGAMVPKFMVSRMMDKAMQKTAEALKQRVHTAPPGPKFEVPEEAAPASPGAPAGEGAPAKKGRHKRMLHVLQSGDGYRVWFNGKTFNYKMK